MTEREQFVEWLETTEPKIPTTFEVEVSWRAWHARAEVETGEIARLNTIINNQRFEIRELKQECTSYLETHLRDAEI